MIPFDALQRELDILQNWHFFVLHLFMGHHTNVLWVKNIVPNHCLVIWNNSQGMHKCTLPLIGLGDLLRISKLSRLCEHVEG